MIEVYKFGGTCLKNQETITQVSKLIRDFIETDNENRLIVTVSASLGITEQIDSMISPFMTSENVENLLDMLKSHHLTILKSNSKNIINGINEELERLKKLIYGMIYLEKIKPEVYDLILTFGERIMVMILGTYLDELNITNEIIYPEDFIVTNGIYKSSSILLEETNELGIPIIKNKILTNKVLIIPGFYGKSKSQKITLLGRSGTDYTGAVLAHISDAVKYTIWKDVHGFMTSDPKRVKDAFTIDYLTYNEAEELSYFGATLLHDKVINVIKKKEIKLYIRHLVQLDALTTIQSSATSGKGLKSISHISDVILVAIGKDDIQSNEEIMNSILINIDKSSIRLINFYNSATSISIICELENLEVINTILSELNISSEISYTKNLSYIVLVGHISAKIRTKINDHFESSLDIHFSKNLTKILVDRPSLDETLIFLHKFI